MHSTYGDITRIPDIEQLEDLISEPASYVIEALGRLDGDIIILGVSGKMGPSLARMAKRASDAAGVKRRIIGVSRFSRSDEETRLQSYGIETIRCDLIDERCLARLPDAANVVFMAGMKFGSTGNEPLIWAMNVFLPGRVCERYRNSRIVAFSSGNIYGLTSAQSGGSVESDAPNPCGEYAVSVLGRERIFEYFSGSAGISTALIRLNYAVEMRYGVLVDVAQRIFAGEPVDVSMEHVNVIWQGDANAMALAAFDHVSSPPLVLNVAGPEILNIREVAEELARLMGRQVTFRGSGSADALLSNGRLGYRLFGRPRVGAEQMLRWTADWVMRGGESLGKPTQFESRDGKF